jgi:hypothetical protein
MSEARRLLVDVRESPDLRGFHALAVPLAVLHIIADRLRSVGLYRLGGEDREEQIACEAFSFDTGLLLRKCELATKPVQHFDVYLSAANTFPWDEVSVAARGATRRTVAALMFGLREFQPTFAGLVIPGHDTVAIAEAVLSELRLVTAEASE